jgi:hypothetical protein
LSCIRFESETSVRHNFNQDLPDTKVRNAIQCRFVSAMENIKIYFQASSIHGFPYVVNRDLHVVEKLLWSAALVIAFVCCGLLIFKIGVKFQEDATVTYTSDTAIPVTEVSCLVGQS